LKCSAQEDFEMSVAIHPSNNEAIVGGTTYAAEVSTETFYLEWKVSAIQRDAGLRSWFYTIDRFTGALSGMRSVRTRDGTLMDWYYRGECSKLSDQKVG
jgi:hypothetical protein